MKKKIKSGVYIVINPAQDKGEILRRLMQLKGEEIAAIQVWDNPDVEKMDEELMDEIIHLFKDSTPVLINNQWEMLNTHAFDGVHFDAIPDNFNEIVSEVNRDFIKGVTLGNELNIVKKAKELNFDYLSFCSMFPSQTTDSCEIVRPDTVKKCRQMTDLPLFLAGGIRPNNINLLKDLSFQGIAVISGIMSADNPKIALKEYQNQLKTIQ
ncbi:MAG: thiamine phosphate synthase [Bacteroidales bacterium]|nr:thiamine phosphate synthase [Bacteroidales bacterium]